MEEARRPAPDIEDDNISLTSTVEDAGDPDKEYEVEDILIEYPVDGQTLYLVKWTGFNLHECTWEPAEGLSDQLMEMWRETKRKQAAGERKPFDLKQFVSAQQRAREEKEERHRRRNLKRKKKGLAQTPPVTELDTSEEDEAEESNDGDADRYRDGSAHQPTAKSRSQPKKSASLPKLSTSSSRASGVQSPAAASPVSQTSPRSQSDSRRNSLGTALTPVETVPANRGSFSVSGPVPRAQTERPSTTGYQGTARKVLERPTPALARSASSSNPSRPAASPKKGKLTAKKSRVVSANIFTGGKVRKQRLSLRDLEVDESKPSTLYQKRSTLRRLELASRERADRAPDPDQLHLIDLSAISKGKSAIAGSTGASATSPIPISSPTESLPFSEPKSATEPRSALASRDSLIGPSVKRRKSVRFAEEDGVLLFQEPEPMDIDSPTGEKRASTHPRSTRGTGGRLGSPPAPLASTQAITKKIMLGRNTIIETQFNDMPSDPRLPWLEPFMAEETFNFRHACLAQTFQARVGDLINETLASGTLTSKFGESSMDQIAGFLRSTLLGLFYAHSLFNIIIFPSKCDEWMNLAVQDPCETSASLSYIIFISKADCTDIPPPLTALMSRGDKTIGSGPSEPNAPEASNRETTLVRLLKFDYKRLLPIRPGHKPLSQHNFFLVFPTSKGSVMMLLNSWLRACDPRCRVFTSHHAGSWEAFRLAVDREPGVVIVHELLASAFRQFPKLSYYLTRKCDEYWRFDEPDQPHLLSRMALVDDFSAVNDVCLTRIFALRTAILLTPSFLLSEPRRTKELLRWFSQKDKRGFNYRLVTAWNLFEYLGELALEKANDRRRLYDAETPLSVVDKLASQLGLSPQDMDERYQAKKEALDLHLTRVERAGLFDSEEDNSPLVYADQCIDPNDEQSLVNWFGWWSTLRTDQFRKFYVVGSSESIKRGLQGSRRVPIPRYSKATINDPDVVLEAFLQTLREPVDQPIGDNGTRGTVRQFPGDQSGLLRSYDDEHLTRSVSEIYKQIPRQSSKTRRWTLYAYPVSWEGFEMADHFGDLRSHSKRFKDWLDYCWPFYGLNGDTNFNTYVGLFYTMVEDWDPQATPRDLNKVRRHPWIAVYRKPHHSIHDCEIIIWDAHAGSRDSGPREVAEKDLLYMQRSLIRYLEDNTAAKNKRTRIDKVWLGGYKIEPNNESLNALDTTLQYLKRMLLSLPGMLPAAPPKLAELGFKRVVPGVPGKDDSKNVAMDLDSDVGDDESDTADDTRIIFHPPRATKPLPGQRTRCTNKLYESARLARMNQSGIDGTMAYRYTPTLEWYQEQKAEGRGFEHICVEPCEVIFEILSVNKTLAETSTPSGHGGRKETPPSA